MTDSERPRKRRQSLDKFDPGDSPLQGPETAQPENPRSEENHHALDRRYKTLYEQIPAGLMLEDYSLVKQRIDKLKREGNTDIAGYFRTHDEDLRDALHDIYVVDANEALLKMFRLSSMEELREYEDEYDDWENTNWQQFYVGELSTFASGSLTYIGEVHETLEDGTEIILRCTSRIVQGCEDSWAEIITVHEDITERRRTEKMQNEFVSTVSHELRTPLTSIKGSLGLIRSGQIGDMSEQQKELIDVAFNNSHRLIRLINDILDVGAIESGQLDHEMAVMDVGDMMGMAIQASEGYAAEYDVSLVLKNEAADARVKGDFDRLVQVMSNLISNAVKYSPAQGQVCISLGREGASARISVSDNGAGVAESIKDRIFGKFVQADSSDSRQKGGTGLGLFIAKTIIEQHGGKIGLDTRRRNGAEFYFTLPLVDEQSGELVQTPG